MDAFFTQEIVECNRMIDLLYDKIDGYSKIICYFHQKMQEQNQRLDQAYSRVTDYTIQAKNLRGGDVGHD